MRQQARTGVDRAEPTIGAYPGVKRRCAVEDLVETGPVPYPMDEVERPGSIESSRGAAVQRVVRGGALILGGATLGGATAALYGLAVSSGLPFALGMGAMAMGGAGLVELGRAATHFRKYGSTTSLIAFLATTGWGLSTVTAALSNWIGVTVGGTVWSVILHWSMNAFYSLGVVILLLVLRALVLWAIDTEPSKS